MGDYRLAFSFDNDPTYCEDTGSLRLWTAASDSDVEEPECIEEDMPADPDGTGEPTYSEFPFFLGGGGAEGDNQPFVVQLKEERHKGIPFQVWPASYTFAQLLVELDTAGPGALVSARPTDSGKPAGKPSVKAPLAPDIGANEAGGSRLKGKRVMELGAGVGLLGMCAALLGCDVHITDIASAVGIIQDNVDKNLPLIASTGRGGKVSVYEYFWGVTAPPEGDPGFDLVFGCDLVYNPNYFEPLIAALTQLLPPGRGTVCYLISEKRSGGRYQRFSKLLKKTKLFESEELALPHRSATTAGNLKIFLTRITRRPTKWPLVPTSLVSVRAST